MLRGRFCTRCDGVFDGSHRGGADRDARSWDLFLVDSPKQARDFIPLAVDVVILDVFRLHGVKRADADL